MPRHEPICSPFPKFSSLCNFPLLSNQTLYNQMSLVERVICYRGLLIIRMTSNHLTSCCSICICTKTCQDEGNNRATLVDIKTIMEPPREWHQANWKKWRGKLASWSFGRGTAHQHWPLDCLPFGFIPSGLNFRTAKNALRWQTTNPGLLIIGHPK